MYCLTEKDRYGNPIDIDLFGFNRFMPHRSLDIMLRPCMPKQWT